MTGIEKLRDYAEKLKGADRYEAVGANIEALADQIDSETMLRPLFEDGSPVQFGDEFVSWNSKVCTVRTITVSDNIFVINSEGTDNLVVGKRDSHSERVKRPAPNVLDADGVPIKMDDTVWDVRGLGPYTVHSFDKDGSSVYVDEPERYGIKVQHMVKPEMLTHKKQEMQDKEMQDSWERIEEDAAKDMCELTSEKDCEAMTCSECELRTRINLILRCRALAEKEDGR